jgi:fatty-acyl-CoA synthase
LLSRNRPEYIEIELAAANLGVITACLNWRLSPRELAYCIELVPPKLVISEPDLADSVVVPVGEAWQTLEIGQPYERLLQQQADHAAPVIAQPEDGLVILYTSGTTGLPKGAVISHRAMIARALVFSSELSISPRDSFVAWAPMFHMASTDHSLSTLLRGGTVVMIDGFQVDPLLAAVERHQIGWLVLIPGMVEAFAAALKAQATNVRGVRVCSSGFC